MEQAIHQVEAPQRPGRWDFLFSWKVLFFVAWIVYEMTAQAALGLAIFCSKFGWKDFHTACWLRRLDPVPERGKMELWIYLAWGLFCTAFAAFTISSALLAIAIVFGLPVPIDHIKEGGFTALAAGAIGALAAMRALAFAWWHRRKLWLHSSIHMARAENLWPPYPLHSANGTRLDLHGKNKAGMLIGAAVAIIVISPFYAMGIVAALTENEAMTIVFVLFVVFGFPVFILWLRDHRTHWPVAQRPEECWESDEAIEEP